MKRYAFSLVELLIACALMAFCAVFLLQATLSFRSKLSFKTECREIVDLFHEASMLSHITRGEVDIILRIKEDPLSSKNMLFINFSLWNTENSVLKKNIEKIRSFPSIKNIYINGDGEKKFSRSGKVLYRFFPRGLDIQRETTITFIGDSGTSEEYLLALKTIAPKMALLEERKTIPESIEQLAI